MKAITFVVRFATAQFKEHAQKLVRRTYLIPPPSAVAGFFGAIVGLSRKELHERSDKLLAGAELRSLAGRSISASRIFKIDRSIEGLTRLLRDYSRLIELPENKKTEVYRDILGLLPIKESEELYMAEYKFAIASTDDRLIEEGADRLRNLDFAYDVFGGNDYHFVDHIGDMKFGKLIKSTRGRGYCRRADFDRVEANSFSVAPNVTTLSHMRQPLMVPAIFLAKVCEDFLQVYGANIALRKEVDAVDDGESVVFVYGVKPFLVGRI